MKPAALPAVAGIVLALLPAPSRAQGTATVREIFQVVKTGKADRPELASAHIGTSVAVGDRVRTGGRSAAGIRLEDRSTVRLGELTEIVLAGGGRKGVRLNRGQILADYKRPDVISGGYGVAAIRGTHVGFSVDEHGQAEVRCYKGRVFVGTSENPVFAGTTDGLADQALTDPALRAAEVDWSGGELRFVDGPYAGVARPVAAFDRETGAVRFEQPLPALLPGAGAAHGYLLVKQPGHRVVELRSGTGTTVRRGEDPDPPYLIPHEQYAGLERWPIFRELKDGVATYSYPGSDQYRKDREEYFTERRAIEKIVTPRQPGAVCDTGGHVIIVPPPGGGARPRGVMGALKRQFARSTGGAASAAAAGGGDTPAQAGGGGRSGGVTTGELATGEGRYLPSYVRPSPADLSHAGRFQFEPYALSDTEGDYSTGTRLRFQGATGDAYAEVGYLFSYSNAHVEHNVSEGFLELRGRYGDFTAGRQHLYLQLANNQNIGSVLGLETSDAVTYSTPPLKCGVRQQVGYLFDSRALDAGGIRGFFARGQAPLFHGSAGYTVFESPSRGQGALGWSIDAAQPVIRNVVDAYAEGGSDTTGRRIITAGLYIPALYQLAKLDTFLEYGHRDSADDRFTLRVRREFGRGLLAVLFLDHQSGQGLDAGAGVVWSIRFR